MSELSPDNRSGTTDLYALTNSLLNAGVALQDLQECLVDRGIAPDDASRVVNRLLGLELRSKINDRIDSLLARGETPEAIRAKLFEEGFDPLITAERVDQGVARKKDAEESGQGSGLGILGTVLFIGGMAFYLGNRAGIFPTVPYAGGITMALGLFLIAMGWAGHAEK